MDVYVMNTKREMSVRLKVQLKETAAIVNRVTGTAVNHK